MSKTNHGVTKVILDDHVVFSLTESNTALFNQATLIWSRTGAAKVPMLEVVAPQKSPIRLAIGQDVPQSVRDNLSSIFGVDAVRDRPLLPGRILVAVAEYLNGNDRYEPLVSS